MKYNKLVRDKIPEIIEMSGGHACIRILSDPEYMQALAHKLDEETQEYHCDPSMEELADILEVVLALAQLHGGREALINAYRKKHEERGGFEKRILLISNDL